MKALAVAVRDYLRELVAAWNRFWFTPADPATLSAIRICAGLMLFYTHLVWSLDLQAFFGQGGWMPEEVVAGDAARAEFNSSTRFWSYFWWINRAAALWAVHLAGLAVFALLTLGLASRVMAVLAYLIAVAYVHRAPAAFFGLDKINCLLAMYLMLGPCGAYWSLDRWLARRRAAARGEPLAPPASYDGPPRPSPSIGANIAIRLLQVHLCIVYLFSGLDKLQGTTWWNGSAVWQAVANLEYQSLDLTWLATWPRLTSLMTHLTVFWEIFYCVLVWNRLARPLVLAMAVLVHGGIALAMGMPTFGLVMLIANLAFLSPAFVRAVVGRFTGCCGSADPAAKGADSSASAVEALRPPRTTPSRRGQRG